MPLSISTLTALQKAGAAAFIAEEQLQEEVNACADRVNAAITDNAYSLGNDTLIENWKVAARLQHTLRGIEDELRKVYQTAAQLSADDEPLAQDMPALAAPATSATPATPARKRAGKRVGAIPAVTKGNGRKRATPPAKPATAAPNASSGQTIPGQSDLAATDVEVKPRKLRKGAPARRAKAGKVAAAPRTSAPLGANPTKLLAYFDRTLNANDFSAVNLTSTARETGLPLGSMSAAVKKLVETGRIVPGPHGSLKLSASGSSSSVSPSESQPALQA